MRGRHGGLNHDLLNRLWGPPSLCLPHVRYKVHQPLSDVTKRVESLFLISSTAAVMARSAGRDCMRDKKE